MSAAVQDVETWTAHAWPLAVSDELAVTDAPTAGELAAFRQLERTKASR